MSRQRSQKKVQQRVAAPARRGAPGAPAGWLAGWRWAALLAFLLLVFYWTPLTSSSASIQWDAVDVHYSSQKYFADHVRDGKLPYWTPYIFSGFPFLADPQVGAWYPLNWPFFLAGITPKAIQGEIVLHALLACAGAYLLLLRMFEAPWAALFGALAYGLGGYFAGHSSHLGIFSTASLFPWLLYLFRRAYESSSSRWLAAAAATGGCLILAGHFQTALYAFAGLGLFAAAHVVEQPGAWKRAALGVAGIVAPALLISMILALPGLELTQNSLRAGADYSRSRDGALTLGSLATLVEPDALGAATGDYKGPGDITQYYFYGGLLLLPFAVFGAWERRARIFGLILVVPVFWYMLGPSAGLYRVIGLVPGFSQVRAPVHAWFVVALGLSLLAASGVRALNARLKRAWVGAVLVAVLFFDVAYRNCWDNRLAYAPASFDQLYGRGQSLLRQYVVGKLPPLSRFEAPDGIAALGPLNGPLDLRLESTYGYNPLQLSAYADYRSAIASNAALRKGLNAGVRLDLQTHDLLREPGYLARVSFPKALEQVNSLEQSRTALAKLNPAEGSIVLGPVASLRQDANGTARVTNHQEGRYRIHYRAAANSLLRFAVPYFPGWRAEVDGRELPVLRTDHAFLGVVVPAGEKDLTLVFHSDRLAAGALLSFAGWLLVFGLALFPYFRKKPESGGGH